mmetsp:Transcript_19000/g.30207  ORF Transcript_19000/g.30207 Transcript_19000/m.30207 type:complete len:268 (+) Transcript_19000:162-965(+)
MFTFLIASCALGFLAVFLSLTHFGFLHTPKIQPEDYFMMDTVPIWYKYHVGPLMHVGGAFCDLSNTLAQVAKRKQWGSKRFIGLFYDDSRKVSPEQLRWVIGVWETDLNKKQIAALEAEGYKRYELEGGGTHGIRANWRMRPLCWQASISAMITSCYPPLYEYCEEHKKHAGTRVEFFGYKRQGFIGAYIPVSINLSFEDKWQVNEHKMRQGRRRGGRSLIVASSQAAPFKHSSKIVNFFEKRLAVKMRFPRLFRLETRSVSPSSCK